MLGTPDDQEKLLEVDAESGDIATELQAFGKVVAKVTEEAPPVPK